MSALVWVCDTVTGERLDMLQAESASGSRLLSAAGGGSVSLLLRDNVSVDILRDLTRPWARSVVIERDGVVQYAGPIVSRHRQGDRVTLDTEDLWAIWQRRQVIDHNVVDPELWSVKYTGTSLRTLAKRAVQLATSGPPLPLITLPIALEPDVSGTIDRTFYGYHFPMVADVLGDLMDEGLEVDFRPRWVGGNLNYQMVTDFPNDLTHEWIYNGIGDIVVLSQDEDGSRMTNKMRVIGEGSEKKTLNDSRRNFDTDLPQLDRVEDRKTITDEGAVGRMADYLLGKYTEPTREIKIEVPADKAVNVRPGQAHRLFFADDAWLGTAAHWRTVTKVETSLLDTTKITFQTTGGSAD